jgi:hypothetical protein
LVVDVIPKKPDRIGDGKPRRRRTRRSRIVLSVVAALAATGTIVWFGLRTEPAPLPDAGLEPGDLAWAPIPDGLPAPVARFYETLYGEQIPVVETAVISGRGEMRVVGITFPGRYRFSHVAGQGYRHYIEITVFGARLLAVNEWFLDGRARLDMPFGVMDGPEIDQGANLALWAETGWFPSVWLTDPQVRWEAVDDATARLLVPFTDEAEVFTVRFDPRTGLLTSMESMRYKGETGVKVLWITEVLEWGEIDGLPAPMRTSVTWADEGTPWTTLRTEEVLLNADLDSYIREEGP